MWDFYSLVRATMPLDKPGGMKEQEYLDVVAYLLQANHARAGLRLARRRHRRDARPQDRRQVPVVTCHPERSEGSAVVPTCRSLASLGMTHSGGLHATSRCDIGRVACVLAAAPVAAQANMAPVNSLPNPYRTVEGWAKMPEGRAWGSTSAVAIDRDGKSVWVAERCGANVCVGSTLDPVLKFDANGNLVAHFGAGMIESPHGIFVDRDKNVWVVDCSCTGGGGRGRGGAAPATPPPAPAGPPKGHQIFKFSPDGKLLMTLGKPGGAPRSRLLLAAERGLRHAERRLLRLRGAFVQRARRRPACSSSLKTES